MLQLKIADDLKTPIINDPFRIRQILTNLIGNAFKFTDSGHVKVAAVVEEKNKATWVRIDVEDTGIGIPVEKQESIFQEFTQAGAPSQKAQIGYGLGLTISRKLTELLGGKLSLKSKVGKGSTFTVRVPVEFSKIEVVENNSKAFVSKPKELSILVIDDDENMLGLISEVCKINYIKTETLLSFDDFELSKIHQFDAVLTDIQMPTTNGFSVLKTIKSIGYKNPVIAMTGQQIGNKTDYLDPGFSDVLQKPFTANSLLHVLRSTEKVALSNAIPASESSMFTLKNISPFLDEPNAIQEVLQVFLENTNKDLAFLLSAVGDKDYTDIRATSHKMLPMFRQLEIQDAIHLLEHLENISDDAKGEKTFNILSELKEVLSNLESEIQNYLSKHSIDID